MIFFTVSYCQQIPRKDQNQPWLYPTNKYYVCTHSMMHLIPLCRRPPFLSHTVALGDTLLHYHEHTHCCLFRVKTNMHCPAAVHTPRRTKCVLFFVGFVDSKETSRIKPALSFQVTLLMLLIIVFWGTISEDKTLSCGTATHIFKQALQPRSIGSDVLSQAFFFRSSHNYFFYTRLLCDTVPAKLKKVAFIRL